MAESKATKEQTEEKVTVVNPHSPKNIQQVQADAEYMTLRRMKEEEEERERKEAEAARNKN